MGEVVDFPKASREYEGGDIPVYDKETKDIKYITYAEYYERAAFNMSEENRKLKIKIEVLRDLIRGE